MDWAAIPWAELAPFVVIGFCAQLVDGAFGMGFGLLSNALLVVLGIPPAAASATVRTAESFTSGLSGLSHALQRNVDWSLFARLVVPGILGAFFGAWLLLRVHAEIVGPVVLAYLAALGIYLLWRGARRPQAYRRQRLVAPLGFVAALIDTSGGGWGPIATGTLMAQGANPRTVIGTVSAAEFFVTVTVFSALVGTLGLETIAPLAVGLAVGGAVAAPVAAFLVKRLAPKTMMSLVGALLVVGSIYGLLSVMVEQIPAFPRF
ncbi:sulfite exporter TauE/SafE family protein [Sphingomonas cannabina]|uniref:sulfite exporter TauE/SafE family protein n=1 Tax=Sphingomonas cannabina TaxID=2899123 RepID=UPI001F4125DA|nr:sulfite exporter TauE/SafE family protein [Sphingomonas cannabina]UIJ46607.1 sulfite exporter TauE/SafE family protein [Sphingomonas cannabina]